MNSNVYQNLTSAKELAQNFSTILQSTVLKKKVAEELENITKMREELKKITKKSNISEENKEMMHVFVAGLHMNNYSFENVLIASNAFSTFLALWSNENLRKLILKTFEKDIIG